MNLLFRIKRALFSKSYYFFRTYFEFPLATRLTGGVSQINGQYRQILIIRTDHIGDFVLFSPAFRIIKSKFPNHRIVFLGDKNVGGLVSKFPEIDEFIPIDIKKFQFDLRYYLSIFKLLRKRYFEQVIYPVYSRSFFGDELVRMSNADQKIGFIGDNSNMSERWRLKLNEFYTRLVDSPAQQMNEVERNKSFLTGLQMGVGDNFVPTIQISEDEKSSIRDLLTSCGWAGGSYVMINPGSNLSFKNWPRERFAEVASVLHARGFEIVITGSKNEQVLFDEIQRHLAFPIINLIGKTSLNELVAVSSLATFYFGTDTGSMHIAAAAGAPVIGLIGGGHFDRFFPYGDLNRNRAVYDRNMKCKNDNWECAKTNGYNAPAPCIAGISVENAIKEIDSLLGYLSKAKE